MTSDGPQFCGHCGTRYLSAPLVIRTYPRKCPVQLCAAELYDNPAPVAVVLQPVEGNGLVLVRRAIAPQKGFLAFPGGFVVKGESWQQGGGREYKEETGASLDPSRLNVVQVSSTSPDGARILIFAVAPIVALADLPPFVHNDEVIERVIAYAPCELAFPLHTQVMADFFKKSFKQVYSFERLLDLEEDVFTWINSLPDEFTGSLNVSITQEST